MDPILSRKLEVVWSETSEPRKLQATTEARVALGNLVHYSNSRGYYLNDVVTLAATLLDFAKQPVAGKSNVISEEQTAKLARRIAGIAMQFNEGAIMDNEMLAAILTEFSNYGVL